MAPGNRAHHRPLLLPSCTAPAAAHVHSALLHAACTCAGPCCRKSVQRLPACTAFCCPHAQQRTAALMHSSLGLVEPGRACLRHPTDGPGNLFSHARPKRLEEGIAFVRHTAMDPRRDWLDTGGRRREWKGVGGHFGDCAAFARG